MSKIFGTAVGLSVVAAMLVVPSPADATTAAPDRSVAYVRAGDIYVSSGRATERRLTTGGRHSRPRWSPDGRRIAFLRAGLLWIMNANGSGKRRLTTRPAGGPAWSPDSRWIAFASTGCNGGDGVYRISTAARPKTEALFPVECRRQALPPVPPVPRPATGSLAERLRRDNSVAWSPNGRSIAFRGGECTGIYDDCLSLGDVATGRERVLAAYGGGGQDYSGFAVIPAFRRDGARITWTAWQEGHNDATTFDIHIVEYDPARRTVRRIGVDRDREMVYEGSGRGLVTGLHRSGSWIIAVNLATGARTPLYRGSQPSIRP
jgi:TolB protein